MVTALTADSADRFCFSLVSLDRGHAKFQNGDRGAAYLSSDRPYERVKVGRSGERQQNHRGSEQVRHLRSAYRHFVELFSVKKIKWPGKSASL